MTKNYRNNAFTPSEIRYYAALGGLADAFTPIIDVDFTQMTHEGYLEWVKDWKAAYEELELEIIANKRNLSLMVVGGEVFFMTQEQLVNAREQGVDNDPDIEPVSTTDAALRMSFAAVLKKFANTLLNARQYGKQVRYKLQQEARLAEAA